ncbi:probable basic-leucine zipper transcription factor E [Mytilus trossulus]|uniref:probable basic-leucine zipper transcription factor E n=1 Tax=Mytilus trossulus TaxID=6551 RepID=UPI0030073946
MYYTTRKCLVQGNSCQNWVEREFDKIKRCVDICLRGNNPKQLIDNYIRKMNGVHLPHINESEVLNSSQTIPKTIDESTDEINDTTEMSESVINISKTHDHINMPDCQQKGEDNNNNQVEDQFSINLKLIAAFHSLENKFVECHTEFNKKIDNMSNVVKQWEEKCYSLEKSKQELENKLQTELSNMNTKLEQIKSFIQTKEVTDQSKKDEDENIDTDKTRQIHADTFCKLTQLENLVTEKLESIEKKCTNFEINNDRKHPGKGSYENNLSHPFRQNVQHDNHDNRGQSETRYFSEQDVAEPNILRAGSQNNHENNHLWIVGTSVVKDLKKTLMYRFKKVSITTLRDKTVQGAKEFLETGKINAKNILFQVGSNDLEAKQPTNVVEEIEQLIVDTKKSMPESQIIISQILPRFYRNQNMDQEFEVKRVECNQLLYELCKQYEAYYVQHENLTQVHFQDGIHLNKQRGIKLYVRNLKEIVNPLIGVKNDDQDNSRNHHVREKPDGAPNYTRYRQPNKMYNDRYDDSLKQPRYNDNHQYHQSNRNYDNSWRFNNHNNNQKQQDHAYGYNGNNRWQNNNNNQYRNDDINLRMLRIALGM